MGIHYLVIRGQRYAVEVGARTGGRVNVRVNGASYDVELDAGAGPASPVGPSLAPPRSAAAAASEGDVRSPMAGLVLSVAVAQGQRVQAGETLVMLEAMKMENAIGAPTAGTVQRVAVAPQQTVAQGDLLVELTPD